MVLPAWAKGRTATLSTSNLKPSGGVYALHRLAAQFDELRRIDRTYGHHSGIQADGFPLLGDQRPVIVVRNQDQGIRIGIPRLAQYRPKVFFGGEIRFLDHHFRSQFLGLADKQFGSRFSQVRIQVQHRQPPFFQFLPNGGKLSPYNCVKLDPLCKKREPFSIPLG